ncbi:lysozyme [Umezawaea beigongshangensis]|uniref:lysozyme n=1 Tax=Umezawaea beigongshangensis TaxID=2780383 RepID=UPI0018F1FA04|nr:lysozyme [Umezawaea beigongshangensis]
MTPFAKFTTALATCASTLLLITAVPAGAAAAPAPDDLTAALQRENHTLGSQIREHEGGDEQIVVPADPSSNAVVEGIDVASYQGNVNWSHYWNQGKRFAYTKATEGTSYLNPYFAQQYNGSYDVGMIRGAYHFALPDRSSGATQANYFLANGGGWSRDGRTLPGALDVEYNPYGGTCYGLSASAMVNWILDFSNTYHARTGVWPVIYTSTNWWNQCTGSSGDFSSTNPLWVARYASTVGALPYRWQQHTIWQYSATPIDQNQFNGGYDRLQALANG